MDGGDVADVDGGVLAGPDRDRLQVLDLPDQRVDRHDRHLVADPDVARGADGVARADRADHLVGRHLVRPEAIRVDADHDRALVAAERGRGRHARQAGEHRPDLEERLVLNLADTLGLAPEHEVADRDAADVEPHDERRDRPRGHEGARAGHVAHGLGHRLRHVGAGVEEQLHQGDALDVAALDVVDAVDVEEVVFVVVGEQPLHLGRVHAAIRLGDVDDGQVQVGEDVDRHAVDGQAAAEGDGDHEHHHGERPPHGEDDRIHGLSPFGRWSWWRSRSGIPVRDLAAQSGQLALGSKMRASRDLIRTSSSDRLGSCAAAAGAGPSHPEATTA